MEQARKCNRYEVLTKNTYKNTVLKESQIAAMDEFIDNVKILINALGYKVLEPSRKKAVNTNSENELLYLTTGSVNAKGMVTVEGFLVLAGSLVNEKTSEKSLSKGMVKLRRKHFDAGKVKELKTVEDILFSSS